MPLQIGSLDVTDQLHAVGRHPQAGEFVLSPRLPSVEDPPANR